MKDIVDFLNNSRSAYNATQTIKEILDEKGYECLSEKDDYKLEKGHKYYVTRNDSSIIAFNVGNKLEEVALHLTSSHTDCPSFYLKPNSTIYENGYLKLNNEVYGGPIFYTWLDRPLSIAGRVIVKDEKEVKSIVYDYKKPFCLIPSMPIHFNRDVNNNLSLNPQVDMLPIVSLDKKDIKDVLKEDLNKEVLSYDLYLYPLESACIWGDNEFITSQHLDDLQCAYTCLMGFIDNFNEDNINVYACFDNEETGSCTRQGANSDFLENTLKRICSSLDVDYYRLLANGFMLSCDNGHALHPNHPEKYDIENRTYINKGVIIKHAIGKYTSDGLSMGIIKDLFNRNNIPYQFFTNRSDLKGGGTLGNISNAHSSLLAVDLGLPQLAMHSCIETAGLKDSEYMIKAMKAFYKSHLKDKTLV